MNPQNTGSALRKNRSLKCDRPSLSSTDKLTINGGASADQAEGGSALDDAKSLPFRGYKPHVVLDMGRALESVDFDLEYPVGIGRSARADAPRACAPTRRTAEGYLIPLSARPGG